MRNGILLIVMIVGCKSSTPPSDPPKPTIRVERQEDANGVVLKIWYDNHHQDYLSNRSYSEPYAKFYAYNNEELQEYKRQLEFVLLQIEEIEKRMTIHEPDP